LKSSRLALYQQLYPPLTTRPLLLIMLPLRRPAALQPLLTTPQPLLTTPPPLKKPTNALPRQVVEDRDDMVVGVVDAVEDVDAVDNSQRFPSVT
jgi:hypothetical protein